MHKIKKKRKIVQRKRKFVKSIVVILLKIHEKANQPINIYRMLYKFYN